MTAQHEDEAFQVRPVHLDGLAAVHQFLSDNSEPGGAGYVLASGDGLEGAQTVHVPAEVHRALRHVVAALDAGRAVTVFPQDSMLTTQQAADLLHISRPTLVKLIDSGSLRGQRVSNRRQVLLGDVLALRRQRRSEQYALLLDQSDEPVDASQATVLAELRQARKAVAARRRRHADPR